MAGLATAALAAATLADAGPAQTVQIAAGPLDAALRQLAAETNEQLLFSPEMVAGRRAPAVVGKLTTEEALAQLLAATDISVTRVGPAVLVLRSGHPAQKAAATTPLSTAREGQAGHPFAAEPASGAPAPATLPVAPPPAVTPPNAVSEVEVTGTHIRGVTDSPSPVQVISRAELDRSGYQTVAEALQVLPQNFSGAGTENTAALATDRTSGNSFYATGVNLRGLGPSATLVLVNGHRLAGTGTNGDFADLSTLPSGAVERVEVLTDGASAIYGSDAVGGVVNIIMRRNFDGAETRVSDGVATRGSPAELDIAQTFGKTWASGGVVVSYEHERRGDLPALARSFSDTANLTALGGTDHRSLFSHPGNILGVNPATGLSTTFAIPTGQNGVGLTPGQLVAGTSNLEEPFTHTDILPRQVRDSVYASVTQSLGERVDLTADVTYGRRRFDLETGALTSTLVVNRGNPYFVSPVGATSEQIQYSFADDLPAPHLEGLAQTLAVTVGAQVKLPGDWRLSTYGAYAEDRSRTAQTGLLNSSNLSEALGSVADRPQTAFSTAADGFFNPFGAGAVNNATVLAFIGSGYAVSETTDKVGSVDAKADGTLFHLPAGPVLAAVGLDWRYESYDRTGSSFTSGFAPTPATPTAGDRYVSAAYLELRAPIFDLGQGAPGRLELSLAGRVEHYSDFGTTSNPKIGLIWTPDADVRLRASWGTSFRAPSLPELSGPAIYGPSLLPKNGVNVLSVLLAGGNPDLQPETARSWSLGFDATPSAVPGLRLSATWFDTVFSNRIDQPVRQSLVTALSNPAVASFITLVSPATSAADLARVQALISSPAFNTGQGVFPAASYGAIVDERFVNTGTLHVSGLDVQAAYGFDLRGVHLGLSGNGAYMARYDQQLTPTGATIDQVGVANFPVRFRGRAAVEAARGPFSAQVAINYVDAYHDALGVGIGDQVTTDLQLRFQAPTASPLAGLTATLSVRNLFDRNPPFYNSPIGVAYDPANADPIGRFVALQVVKAW